MAINAQLSSPSRVALDRSGNLYVADLGNNRVRKISTSGIITTVAGTGTSGNLGDGGAAMSAQLARPEGIVLDGSGNLYIADSDNNRIRKVSPSGTITTVAGSGTASYSGDGGQAASAGLWSPSGIAVDGSGALYIADRGNNCVRRVSPSGIITTIAGGAVGGYSGDGGPATKARLWVPSAVTLDASGNLYIADTENNVIRRISPSGIITTVAGSGLFSAGFSGDGGAATSARLNYPFDVAVDGSSNLYIADNQNHRIRKVSSEGIITTVAGNNYRGFSGDDGAATNASLYWPTGVTLDVSGNLYVADSGNNRIRLVHALAAASLSIIATSPLPQGKVGTAYSQTLTATGGAPPYSWSISAGSLPNGLSLSGGGTISGTPTAVGTFDFFARVQDAASASATAAFELIIVATGSCSYSISPGSESLPAAGGSATIAVTAGAGCSWTATSSLSWVTITGGSSGTGIGTVTVQVAVNTGPARAAYITIAGQSYSITQGGPGTSQTYVVSAFAGTGAFGYAGDGGSASSAKLDMPAGLFFDGLGDLYIADEYNSRIRKVSAGGIISTVAGGGGSNPGDGGPATGARLSNPEGVAVDGAGNVYLADTDNHRVRKVSAAGIIATLAGTGSSGYSGDGGPASSAQLNSPAAAAVDGSGNVYIADTYNFRIRKVSPEGIITTVAGTGTLGHSGDGGPATGAKLGYSKGLTLDQSGNLYIAETLYVRVVTPGGIISTIAGGGVSDPGDGEPATSVYLGYPHGVAVDGSGNVYFTEKLDHRVRKVSPGGIITTIAGTGTEGDLGDGGPATSAMFDGPSGLALDGSGNLYIADSYNNRVRILRPTGSGTLSIVTATALPQGMVGAAYSQTLAASGGAPPYTWLATSGALPGGLTLNSGGTISGTPTAAGTYGFTVQAKDTVASTANATFALAISAAAACTYSINPTGQSFPTTGGTASITVTATTECSWTATSSLSYVTITSGASGTGNGTATVQVAANTGPARSGSITIAGQAVWITQAGLSCTYSIYPAGQAFLIAGGTGTITVTAPAGCSWSVSGAPAWINITGGVTGTGNGTVTYQAVANSGDWRKATFTVADVSFVTEQSSATVSGLTLVGAMPHVATAGGWQTAIMLVNLGTATAMARLDFFDDNGAASQEPICFPQAPFGGTFLAGQLERTIAPGAAVVVQTCGTGNTAVSSWARLQSNGGITGFARFNWTVGGGVQEAVVPLESRTPSSFVVWYDHTDGFATGMALANMAATGANVAATVRDDTGAVLATDSFPLSAYGHTAFMVGDKFPATALKRGTIEFQVPAGGQIGTLAFRASAAGTLSTIPAIAKTGQSGGAPGVLATVGGMPHIATAGGWQTAIMLVNLGTATAQARLNFFDDNGFASPQPLCFPQATPDAPLQTAQMDRTIAPGAALVVQTCGTGANAVSSWAQLQSDGDVTGFARFNWTIGGGVQEAVVPLESRTPTSFVLWYDHTDGFATGMAVANMAVTAASVAATVRDDTGAVLATDFLPFLADGHTAFMVGDKFPATALKRGTIEFQVPAGGQIGTLAFRASAAGTLSTIPSLVKAIQVSLLPATATVQTGHTVQFTATVTGASNLTVSWSVNGISGGNSTVGTISANGLYTAPQAVPNLAAVTVTASSVADTSRSANATVTVVTGTSASLTSGTSSLAFASVAGSTNPSRQSLTISSATGSPLTLASAPVTTSDGQNWLLISPSGTTTPFTLDVSVDITGMGAGAFTGTITLAASGSTAPPLVINVSLNLASPQPPYFTGSYSFTIPPQGPMPVTMPDGSVLTQASNQLLVYLSQGVTLSQMQDIALAIGAGGGQVVGEIFPGQVLQVQLQDISRAANLMTTLRLTAGVVDVEPNLFASLAQNSCPSGRCQNGSPKVWRIAENLPTPAASQGRVVILVVDCFDPVRCPSYLTDANGKSISHGDLIAGLARQASGGTADISEWHVDQDREQKGRNYVIPDAGELQKDISIFIQINGLTSDRKLVVNLSWGQEPSDNKANDAVAESKFTSGLDEYAARLAADYISGTGPDTAIIKAAGNAGVGLDSPLASSNLVLVGGLDPSLVRMWEGTNFGSAVDAYAPACITGINGSACGTSVSAAWATGLTALFLVNNPQFSVPEFVNRLSNLPLANNMIPVLPDETVLAQAEGNPPPDNNPPSLPFGAGSCPFITASPQTLILNTTTNKTGTIIPTLLLGGSGSFKFISSNANVATVDSTGKVTAVGPGTALISVTAPNVPCQAVVTVIVNGSETYAGSATFNFSAAAANAPNCTPNPYTITGSAAQPIQIVVSPALLSAGVFNGVVTFGGGTETVTVPGMICVFPGGIISPVPGLTVSDPVPATSGDIVGVMVGPIINIPVPGFPPITGTVTAGGLTLNWTLSEFVSGVTVQIQLSATLTKQ
ncbi:MAG: putative Ig domain-containing protein [Bryobacteraceae bacterium]